MAFRFILAGAEQLHDKIFELGDRVRQLEEALDEFYQKTYVGKTHPLLAPDLLKIKTSQELYGSASHFSASDAHEESLHQSVGALSLSSQPTYAESSRPTVSAEYMSRNAPPDVAPRYPAAQRNVPFPMGRRCQHAPAHSRGPPTPRAEAQRICEEARSNALWQ